MSDRFKFRGMTLGGEWVYGNLAIINKKIKSCGMTIDEGYYISNKVGMPFAYPVRPETIGQCTGLKDKNGNLIYEGDIVECDEGIGKVFYSIPTASLGIEFSDYSIYGSNICHYDIDVIDCVIIGNIHENKELLNDR